ncbi:MAG: hypothetical protein E7363_04345 [Clostridiales bacterium]|nr:hypothetical protein [Clostridiales bacterium]
MRKVGKLLQWVLLIALIGAFLAFTYVFVKRYDPKGVNAVVFACLGAIVGALATFFLHPIIHEFGHVFFGKIAGLKLIAFRAGVFVYAQGKFRFALPSMGGECVMLPKSGKKAETKRRVFAWGGIIGSLIFFLSLVWAPFSFWLSAPVYAGLTTAALYAGYELFSNVSPSEGREKTDGEVLFASYKRTPESVVESAVFVAQSYVLTGETPAEIPYENLYKLPVISEGEPSFALLTYLRLQRATLLKNKGEMRVQLSRLQDLLTFTDGDAYLALLCEGTFAFSLLKDKEKAEQCYAELIAENPEIPARYRAESMYFARIKGDMESAEKAEKIACDMIENLHLPGEKHTENALLSLYKNK